MNSDFNKGLQKGRQQAMDRQRQFQRQREEQRRRAMVQDIQKKHDLKRNDRRNSAAGPAPYYRASLWQKIKNLFRRGPSVDEIMARRSEEVLRESPKASKVYNAESIGDISSSIKSSNK